MRAHCKLQTEFLLIVLCGISLQTSWSSPSCGALLLSLAFHIDPVSNGSNLWYIWLLNSAQRQGIHFKMCQFSLYSAIKFSFYFIFSNFNRKKNFSPFKIYIKYQFIETNEIIINERRERKKLIKKFNHCEMCFECLK